LVDSLVHDARNPLNALAINIEVLSNKLRQSADPGTGEENVRAIREQIFRVDNILRMFAEFLAPRLTGGGEVKLSELVEAALSVAGHEARKKKLRMVDRVEPGLSIWLQEAWSASFLVLQPILRAIKRADAGSDVEIALVRTGTGVELRVTESRSMGEEEAGLAAALESICRENGGLASVHGGVCLLSFPSMYSEPTSGG
jgi:signal transduction histidine kinase